MVRGEQSSPAPHAKGQDGRKTVLWLTYGLPWPTDRGGPIRYFNLLRQVATRYRVLLFAMLESADEARHVPKLAPFCERVEWEVMRAGDEYVPDFDFSAEGPYAVFREMAAHWKQSGFDPFTRKSGK